MVASRSRLPLRGLARALFASLLFLSCQPAPPPPRGGSAVIVLVDTLRADHLGCYGYPQGTSPEIDRLARGGLTCRRAYTTAPWTYPSSASLVTGLYPAAHGAYTRGEIRNHTQNPYPPELSPGIETLPGVLTNFGWRTALFSANAYVGFGIERGFEHHTLVTNDADGQVDDALEWLAGLGPNENFLAVVHLIDVHEPNRPPRRFRQMFPGGESVVGSDIEYYGSSKGDYGVPRPAEVAGWASYRTKRLAIYDASIRFADQAIGRLARELERTRGEDGALFLVTADHGEEFWDHSDLEHANYPDPRNVYGLAHGHSFFEELVRIPLVLRGAGCPAGEAEAEPVSLVDVMPTVLDRFGVKADFPMQGVSLAPSFRGEPVPERTLLLDALAYGRDKQAVVNRRHKLFVSEVEPSLLFDLRDDPAERQDLSMRRGRTVEKLRADLDSLLAESAVVGPARGFVPGEDATPSDEQVEILKALGYVE